MGNRVQTRAQQKKELYKLAIARSDIFSAQRTCKVILDKALGLNDELYTPLFNAAVVAYGRPFVDNKSTGVLSRHWSEFESARLRSTHETLLRTRHEIVAHSDLEARPLKIVPPGTPIQIGQKVTSSPSVGFYIESYCYDRQLFVDARETCADLIGRLNTRLDELIAVLYEGKALPSGTFSLTFDDEL